VVARIDISKQTMTVSEDGNVLYSWRVSTARSGYRTPRGNYRPTRMHKMWYSRKYDMSPMPYSIFFHGGYAIHGTDAVSHLGRPASHGCVRLAPGNARTLYNLVKAHGAGNTRIVLVN
jgi:lipoprotein-anchoring transpeptidase ErfK/SrfK